MKAAEAMSRLQAQTIHVHDGPSARLSQVFSVFSLVASIVAIIITFTRPADVSTPLGVDVNTKTTQEIEDFEPEIDPASHVWVFGYPPNYKPYSFLDKGVLRGLSINIVDAVCQRAGMNCRHVLVLSEFCHDPETSRGRALMANWVDACVGFFKSVERINSFAAFAPFYHRITSRFVDLTTSFPTNQMSTKKVGMLAGFYADDSCLNHNRIRILSSQKFKDVDAAVEGLKTGSVDALLIPRFDEETSQHFVNVTGDKSVNAFHCAIDGAGLLSKKGSQLTHWFPVALEQIKEAGEYESLCHEAQAEFKVNPHCVLNRI